MQLFDDDYVEQTHIKSSLIHCRKLILNYIGKIKKQGIMHDFI